MFFYIGLSFLLLCALPLLRTLSQATKVDRTTFFRRMKVSLSVLIGAGAILIGFNIFFSIYTDFLWFENLTYGRRFWTVLLTKTLLFLAGTVISFLFLYGTLKTALPQLSHLPGPRKSRPSIVAFIFALFLGMLAINFWHETLLYIFKETGQLVDPAFGKPVHFYLFSLPFFTSLVSWLLLCLGLTIIVLSAYFIIAIVRRSGNTVVQTDDLQALGSIDRHLILLGAFLFFVLSFNAYLDIFRLMYSTEGVVNGAGYVDVHFRRLGHIVSLITYLCIGAILLGSAFSEKIRQMTLGIHKNPNSGVYSFSKKSALLPSIAILLLVTFNALIPSVVLSLRVKPNEITLEKPFIEHNIDFTQRAYGIDTGNIEQTEYRVGKNITPEIIRQNPKTIDNIRLWDPRALMDNLKEQQEIRLYYAFNDVDIDRYRIKDEYTQVMLTARELAKSELDPQSRTWVSRKLKYTHGYGLVLLPVHQFLPQGKPNLLIKNIPPEESLESIHLQRPEIYYGEKTDDHVYVQTTEKEFDYPSGDRNVYTEYEGRGGVGIGPLIRRIGYAWKFDDYRLFFSTYFTRRSRVLFRRNILQRINMLVPFLIYDRDPYAIITREGRIKFITDAYTVSDRYPYSEKYAGTLGTFRGINYIRNSVKVVVDAYDGTVDYYVIDSTDIMLQTYNNIFPDLFTPFEKMPEDIRKHIRYPVDYLTIQAEMYSTYHMEDPAVFYQREDVWEFATERYREAFQDVEPYYVMINFPQSEEVEFALITAFTPKNKNVINAWIAGRCDFPHYGKLMVFTFPKGIEVLGPRQIEARIDQNTEMSQAMTLWGQRGSTVIRGNLLAIPLFDTESMLYILYAEPIYLQAEDAQLPEIKRIALADQERVVWADQFETALERLTGMRQSDTRRETTGTTPARGEQYNELIRNAVDHFESYKQMSAEGKFSEAGKHIEKLSGILKRLEQRRSEQTIVEKNDTIQ
jgi:hypothetical protein